MTQIQQSDIKQFPFLSFSYSTLFVLSFFLKKTAVLICFLMQPSTGDIQRDNRVSVFENKLKYEQME